MRVVLMVDGEMVNEGEMESLKAYIKKVKGK